MHEASKAAKRRAADNRYNEWFTGSGIDVGCGDDPIKTEQYPNVANVYLYDHVFGQLDAMTLPEIKEEQFDFVHSSHCLEHVPNPEYALDNWLRVCKTGGYIICTIPDELLYEQGMWPSRFNGDHKVSFTLREQKVIPTSINVKELLGKFGDRIAIKEIKLLEDGYDYKLNMALGSPFTVDQTYSVEGPECAIEFVIQKLK